MKIAIMLPIETCPILMNYDNESDDVTFTFANEGTFITLSQEQTNEFIEELKTWIHIKEMVCGGFGSLSVVEKMGS